MRGKHANRAALHRADTAERERSALDAEVRALRAEVVKLRPLPAQLEQAEAERRRLVLQVELGTSDALEREREAHAAEMNRARWAVRTILRLGFPDDVARPGGESEEVSVVELRAALRAVGISTDEFGDILSRSSDGWARRYRRRSLRGG